MLIYKYFVRKSVYDTVKNWNQRTSSGYSKKPLQLNKKGNSALLKNLLHYIDTKE